MLRILRTITILRILGILGIFSISTIEDILVSLRILHRISGLLPEIARECTCVPPLLKVCEGVRLASVFDKWLPKKRGGATTCAVGFAPLLSFLFLFSRHWDP